MCHYALADDFGEERAAPHNEIGETRSQMMKMSLASLVLNLDYPAEIIVVDNGPRHKNDSNELLDRVDIGEINTYVRNKENMYFGWAWDQGAALATGNYLCFTCNDILFHEGWLSTCMYFMNENSDGRYITTPLITPDKDNDKYNRGYEIGFRLNTLAGSNCMVMQRRAYWDVDRDWET